MILASLLQTCFAYCCRCRSHFPKFLEATIRAHTLSKSCSEYYSSFCLDAPNYAAHGFDCRSWPMSHVPHPVPQSHRGRSRDTIMRSQGQVPTRIAFRPTSGGIRLTWGLGWGRHESRTKLRITSSRTSSLEATSRESLIVTFCQRVR